MTQIQMATAFFAGYILITLLLAVRGMLQTKGFASFAIGKQDMSPWIVGLTMAAATASTATFVINPGFVYKHGVSAFLHFAVASPLGVITALALFSRRFRQIGEAKWALTLPQWIEKRFSSPALGTYFAWMNLLLSITFIVLIVKGSALVMQHSLGLTYIESLIVVVAVVFSYIFIGGTYAHAYTNAFQGAIMLFVVGLLVFSGLHYFADGISGFTAKLGAIDPNLVQAYNPASPLFSNFWEVFLCSFLISIGLACQPHILMKSMYLKSEAQVPKFVVIAAVVGIVYAMILVVGFYARLKFGSDLSQDAVVAVYITKGFSGMLGAVISVALLAAGMSTLDGILISASTIAANDIVLKRTRNRKDSKLTEEQAEILALRVSRIILVVLGIVSFVMALNPPKFVGLFAQMGIYGLTAASLLPMVVGLFAKEEQVHSPSVFAAAVIGPIIHFSIYGYKVYYLGQIMNPAVSASIGIVVSFVVYAGLLVYRNSQVEIRGRRTALSDS